MENDHRERVDEGQAGKERSSKERKKTTQGGVMLTR